VKVNHDWVSSDASSTETHVGSRGDYVITDRREPGVVNVAAAITGNRERFILINVIQ
jgi:hypothetical protein